MENSSSTLSVVGIRRPERAAVLALGDGIPRKSTSHRRDGGAKTEGPAGVGAAEPRGDHETAPCGTAASPARRSTTFLLLLKPRLAGFSPAHVTPLGTQQT